MYRAVILDDESIIREGIRIKIARNGFPLQVAAEYASAQEALDAFENPSWLPADLIFLDIKMPGMDGLSLAAELKKRNLGVPHIIVISGYSDFEFTGRAISIGVDHYLLKPIKNAQFKSVVESVLEKIDLEREKALRAESDRLQLLDADHLRREKAVNVSICPPGEHVGPLEKASALLVISDFSAQGIAAKIIGDFLQKTEASSFLNQYRNYRNEQEWILIADTLQGIQSVGLTEQIKKFFLCYPELVVGASIQPHRQEFLWQLYGECQEALPMRFFNDDQNVFLYRDDTDRGRVLAAEDIIWFNAKLGEVELCFNASSDSDLLKRIHVSVKTALKDRRFACLSAASQNLLFREMIFVLLKAAAIRGTNMRNPQLDAAVSSTNLQHLRDMSAAVDCVENIVRLAVGRDRFNSMEALSLTTSLRLYIEQNYNRAITLNDLGQRFNSNAAYLSSLFKKEFQVNITDYQNRLRVERGKELLCDSDMKIIDISVFLGFNDQQYFCRVFHNYTGISPRNYRLNYRNNPK